jgi:hypothetical protein
MIALRITEWMEGESEGICDGVLEGSPVDGVDDGAPVVGVLLGERETDGEGDGMSEGVDVG